MTEVGICERINRWMNEFLMLRTSGFLWCVLRWTAFIFPLMIMTRQSLSCNVRRSRDRRDGFTLMNQCEKWYEVEVNMTIVRTSFRAKETTSLT